jgi:hypothetical protein
MNDVQSGDNSFMKMLVRDNRKTFEYYTLALSHKENRLKEFLGSVNSEEHDNTPALWTFIQALYFDMADLMYSRGDGLQSIKIIVEKGLEVQSIKMHHYRKRRISLQDARKEEKTDNYPEFKKVFSNSAAFQHYYNILQILSRAIIFDVDKKVFQKYAEDVTIPGVDFIFDCFISSFGIDWPVKGKLNYPKKLEELYQASNADIGHEIESNLKIYILSWLTKLRGHPLFGAHMMNDYNYTGYWCFEAAAMAKLKRIDTSSLVGLKHFPYEIINGE